MTKLSSAPSRLACWALLGLLPATAPAQGSWDECAVTFRYDPAFYDGPKIDWNGATKSKPFETATVRFAIPAGMRGDERIRGVMRPLPGLMDFAHRNRIALYSGQDAETPYGGPHRTMLAAAARQTGHPEIRYAGVILQGLSNLGRFAAHYAHFYPERVIAVLLDHSWTTGTPVAKVELFHPAALPLAPGIPFLLKASQSDRFQDFDRRSLHFAWCTTAFRQHQQPCTSIIDHKPGNHGTLGSRDLHEVWLEEVLARRVPLLFGDPRRPYSLLPIHPAAVGGHVTAQLVGKDKVTRHTEVQVGPAGFARDEARWWLPGPRTAAKYLDWVKKNGGTVRRDLAHKISPPPTAKTLDRSLKPAYDLARKGFIARALAALNKHPARRNSDPQLPKRAKQTKETPHAVFLRTSLDNKVDAHLAELDALRTRGDVYAAQTLLKHCGPRFRGIARYDASARGLRQLLNSSAQRKPLRLGKQLAALIARTGNKRRRPKPSDFAALAKKAPNSLYGRKAAAIAAELALHPESVIDPNAWRDSP